MVQLLRAIDWKTVSAIVSPLISAAVALFVFRFQRKQVASRYRLDLLDRRLEVHAKTLLFYQALLDSPEFVRSPAFSVIHRDFILAMKRARALFNPDVAKYMEHINLESFKIKGLKEFSGSNRDPQMVQILYDDAMKAFASIEATIPRLEEAMAPFVEVGSLSN